MYKANRTVRSEVSVNGEAIKESVEYHDSRAYTGPVVFDGIAALLL